MGYVYTAQDARKWEEWGRRPCRRMAAELENVLMVDMIQPRRRESLLDIGCGAGDTLLPFMELGVEVTGIDPSAPMLDRAREKLGPRADLHQGAAEDLPFEDNAFHYGCLIRTLEFVDDPEKALAEACRVTKYLLFIGVENPHSLKGSGLRVKRMFTRTVYEHARFFSIWDLKQLIRSLMGEVPVSWKTVGQLPSRPGWITRRMEQSDLVRNLPFGAFTAMAVTLFPRFRARPLELTAHPQAPPASIVAGYLGRLNGGGEGGISGSVDGSIGSIGSLSEENNGR